MRKLPPLPPHMATYMIIMGLLARRPLTAQEMADKPALMGMSAKALGQHLRRLREIGAVDRDRIMGQSINAWFLTTRKKDK